MRTVSLSWIVALGFEIFTVLFIVFFKCIYPFSSLLQGSLQMSINLSHMTKILQLNNSICIIWDMVAVRVLAQPTANARLYYLSWISFTVSEAKLNLLWTTTMSTDNCSGSPDSEKLLQFKKIVCLSEASQKYAVICVHSQRIWRRTGNPTSCRNQCLTLPFWPLHTMWEIADGPERTLIPNKIHFYLKKGKYMNYFSLTA